MADIRSKRAIAILSLAIVLLCLLIAIYWMVTPHQREFGLPSSTEGMQTWNAIYATNTAVKNILNSTASAEASRPPQ
jgi:hypothetical protein